MRRILIGDARREQADQRDGRRRVAQAEADPGTHTTLHHTGSAPRLRRRPDLFERYWRSLLTLGVVTPVTGPKPFDLEGLLLFTGISRRSVDAAVRDPA